MKNFWSIGAITQAINLDENGLTLILGDNIDQGSNGSRNGVGKTAILQAISYALFGTAIKKVKRDALVNHINKKNMMVTIDYEKDGHKYRIERGRKPAHFKYIVDDNVTNESETDEAQGDTRVTQEKIIEILGFSPLLFQHIVALSTETIPFLKERTDVQRDLIEELLKIKELSSKAEILKEYMRTTRIEIEQQEFKIKLIEDNNKKTQQTLDDLKRKSKAWDQNTESTQNKIVSDISKKMEINYEHEIAIHKDIAEYQILKSDYEQKLQKYKPEALKLHQITQAVTNESENFELLLNHRCHTCGQEIHDERHNRMVKEMELKLEDLLINQNQLTDKVNKLKEIADETKNILDSTKIPDSPSYNTIHEAYEHKAALNQLISALETEVTAMNPFIDQILTIKTNNLQEIDYNELNTLQEQKEHQEFVYRTLTDKKSWIRMQIIEQNLTYLNHRLEYYLKRIGLPHHIKFLSDLSVEINLYGQDYDFGNLSNGESTRLTLGLSWAFRDVFEILNSSINLMFIDELIDNGMDSSGGEDSLAILKTITREHKKNIFLISHKDEFIARVTNVLTVLKEGGFTSYNYETDLQI